MSNVTTGSTGNLMTPNRLKYKESNKSVDVHWSQEGWEEDQSSQDVLLLNAKVKSGLSVFIGRRCAGLWSCILKKIINWLSKL